MKKFSQRKQLIFVLGFIALICSCVAFQVYAQQQMKKYGRIEVAPQIEEVTHKEKDIYTTAYQKEAQSQIDKMIESKDYTLVEPLVISNPYGTNTASVYYYAMCDRKSYVTYQVEAQGAATIKETLVNEGEDNLTLKHEYQLTGLVPGKKNKITIKYYNRKKESFATTVFYVTLKADNEAPKIADVEDGSSKVEMSNGLFALLGHDKSENANIYFYDNNGVYRGRMPLSDYRSDRLLTVNGKMIFSYDDNKIAVMNRKGKITKTIDIGNYELHHDFMYDETSKRLLCLVNDKSKDTIEDVLISVNITNGKVKKVIDFEDLMQDMKDAAVQREDGMNTYGGTELDWLHLNSLDILDNGEIVVSSREQSTLIKVGDIYKKPEIEYLIHGGTLYKGTTYESKQLTQVGDFVANAGQHTITVEKDDSLSDGQYYLYMFNNNFGSSATIPTFDWTQYPGVGTYEKGDTSYYTKYLVDEKKGTYQLAQQFELPYSSIVSSVQQLGDTISFSSGKSKMFGEYDSDGKMIRTFTYEADQYSYRVLKYDFIDFYFK